MSKMVDFIIEAEATDEERAAFRDYLISEEAKKNAFGKTGSQVYEHALRLLIDLVDRAEMHEDISGSLALRNAIEKFREEI